MRVFVALMFVGVFGCAAQGGGAAIEASTLPSAMVPPQVLEELSEEGPERFAMVSPTLYRGGHPSARDLELLRQLGVTRIIDLRRERLGSRRAERAEARRLGLEYVEFPFYGLFGADLAFLDRLLAQLQPTDGGAVYVHCDGGRDRTSLVVALHRVVAHGWSPDVAWEREVLDFGHRPSVVRREIELTFRDYTHEYALRQQTAAGSTGRRQAVIESASGLASTEGGASAGLSTP
jgi:protein tyrosine phosphatase (PTP) superfamily phosphohydrolase (DUF442 family)